MRYDTSRIAVQEWYEDAEEFEWRPYGWYWEDNGDSVDDDEWMKEEVLDRDKHYNEIKARFVKRDTLITL